MPQTPQQPQLTNKQTLIGCGGAVLVLFVVSFIGVSMWGNSMERPETNTLPVLQSQPAIVAPVSPSPEMSLAAVQEGHSVSANDPVVQQFGGQLDAMESKCEAADGATISKRQGLANLVITTHDIMARKGVNEDYLSIITHVNASIPPGQLAGKHIADVFAAYCVLRTPH